MNATSLTMNRSDAAGCLRAYIDATLGSRDAWPQYPGGWPDEVEAALIDSVFSANARYGTPSSGVRAVVGRWQEANPDRTLDDLEQLILDVEHLDAPLAYVLNNHQRVPGRDPHRPTKADTVVTVACNLVSIGARTSTDVTRLASTERERLRDAFTRPRGIGDVTFSYFLMLLGAPDIKADRMICRFVATALDVESVDTNVARCLVFDAARAMDADRRQLDHAIWAYQRGIRPRG